ncbi:MAG: scpB [Parcubacteria group bacterium]|nr:scpB [Parcubacteria group bacterium]
MALSLPHTLEALLFAAGEAMPKKRIATLLSISPEMLDAAGVELKEELANRGIALIETKDEFELRTSPDAAVIVEAFRKGELSRDLGKAGLEALAIILYQSGATRSEIDWIRGVNSTAAIRSLLLRGLIERETDSEDKRRVRYTPSIDAYAHLGIRGPEELPNAEALRGMLSQHAPEVELSAEVRDAEISE